MDKLDDRENIENSSLKMPKKSEKRDGNYFLAILKVEKSRILKLAEEAEKDLMKLQVDVSCLVCPCQCQMITFN